MRGTYIYTAITARLRCAETRTYYYICKYLWVRLIVTHYNNNVTRRVEVKIVRGF